MKVLIVTGGFLSAKDDSLAVILKKQLLQSHHSKNSWLEAKIKINIAEPIAKSFLFQKLSPGKVNDAAKKLLNIDENFATPELTEVVLATALKHCQLEFEAITYDDLFRNPVKTDKYLQDCEVVFASSTFLRDLSELEPLINQLKRPWNKIVLGGALTGTLYKNWNGSDKIDILAIGYGEMLVPAIKEWIDSGYQQLKPPPFGKLEQRQHTQFLFSGVPDSLSLDFLPTPDWGLIEKYRNCKYRMIHYESVRGCPYRCAFCNYPYLFDDQKFRMKSAQKMADDWQYYADHLQVEYITCLDSLFTMPKKRLLEFCSELIQRKISIKWICYARADDLCDEEAVQMLIAAGCIQVQIGIESGDQQILNNMNKRVTLEQNAKALQNCRKYGLTSVVSLIVGFPGDNEQSLERTFQFLKNSPPDFHFIATFSTRVPGVPILSEQSRKKFGLKTDFSLNTVSPYWSHDSMSCKDVGKWVRKLNQRLIQEKISLDSTLFYRGIHHFDPDERNELLEFQFQSAQANSWVNPIFNLAHLWIDRNLSQSLDAFLRQREDPPKINAQR